MNACNDLTLDELLRDPLTKAVMQADRVDGSALAALFASIASSIDQVALRPQARPNLGRKIANALRAMGPDGDALCRCGTV